MHPKFDHLWQLEKQGGSYCNRHKIKVEGPKKPRVPLKISSIHSLVRLARSYFRVHLRLKKTFLWIKRGFDVDWTRYYITVILPRIQHVISTRIGLFSTPDLRRDHVESTWIRCEPFQFFFFFCGSMTNAGERLQRETTRGFDEELVTHHGRGCMHEPLYTFFLSMKSERKLSKSGWCILVHDLSTTTTSNPHQIHGWFHLGGTINSQETNR